MSAPTYPQSLYLSPDGAQLYVTFPDANQVWVIDTATNTISYTLSIPVPRGVAFTYFDQYLIVNDYEGKAESLVTLKTGAVTTTSLGSGQISGFARVQ